MSRNILTVIVFAVTLYTVPQYTQASGVSGLDFVYDTEFRFESINKNQTVNQNGSVLGVSTNDTNKKVVVTSKLDKKRLSYFRDISINSPKNWYINEDVKDWYITDGAEGDSEGLITEVNNDEMTAGISITRFDSKGLSLEEYASEIENACTECNYRIFNKGAAKIAGQKGRFVDVSDGEHRMKIYVFISEDVVYFVRLTTDEDEWKSYRKILEKSLKTLKLQ